MTFAMALALAGQGIVIAQTSYGAGKHMGDIDPTKISMGLKLNFISQPIYLFGICIVKLAVGASLLRIASTKGYKWTIIAIMGFMAFYTTGCFFVSGPATPQGWGLSLTMAAKRPLYSNAPIFASFGTRQ